MRIGRCIPPAAAPLSAGDIIDGLAGICRGERETERFRGELKEFFAVRHCFLVSSGKAALTLILESLKELFPERRDVVIPAYTCYSVPAAVLRAGLNIRLCDVDRRTLGFDRKMLAALLKDRPLCLVPTHLFGVPSDIPSIAEAARDAGAIIVEDAAQAMGGEHRGEKLGTLGDAAFFSLGRGKALSTVEGGIILTGRDDIAQSLTRRTRALPRYSLAETLVLILHSVFLWLFVKPSLFWLPKGMPFLRLGETIYESEYAVKGISPFQAGLARNWRKKMERFRKARGELACCWLETLGRGKGRLFFKKSTTPDVIRFPFRMADMGARAEMLREAEKAGLGIMPGYPGPISRIMEIRNLFNDRSYPAAEQVAGELLTLPLHPLVSPRDVERIKAFLKDW